MTRSSQLYPDDVFMFTDDFWLVVQKLYWSCQPTRERSRNGFKRPGLTAQYPRLCSYFDNYFYNNDEVRRGVEGKVGEEFLEWTRTGLEEALVMNRTEEDKFGREVVKYSQDNLAMITAYIGEPFIEHYVMDEVKHKSSHFLDSFCWKKNDCD